MKKYDSTLIPIRDYIAVPKQIVEKMGLQFETGKSLFVKERKGKLAYYIFSSDIDSISQGQRRDIDVINKLWEDNFEDPSNVIRQTENIIGSNGDYKFQVYSLPSRPIRLSEQFVNSIAMEQKMNIITGLCRGIESVHNYDTPLYHRNISPDAFYIFSIRGKYKPLLAKFDCTKDSADATFTVFQNIEKKIHNRNTNQFFAPEVIRANMGIGVDWKKGQRFESYPVDLVIFDSEEHFDDWEHVQILFETKKPSVEEGISQLEIYLSLEPRAVAGYWTNGTQVSALYKTASGKYKRVDNAGLPRPTDNLFLPGDTPLFWTDLITPTTLELMIK